MSPRLRFLPPGNPTIISVVIPSARFAPRIMSIFSQYFRANNTLHRSLALCRPGLYGSARGLDFSAHRRSLPTISRREPLGCEIVTSRANSLHLGHLIGIPKNGIHASGGPRRIHRLPPSWTSDTPVSASCRTSFRMESLALLRSAPS